MFAFEVFFFSFFHPSQLHPSRVERLPSQRGNGEEREVILNCFKPGVSQVKMLSSVSPSAVVKLRCYQNFRRLSLLFYCDCSPTAAFLC